jgi:hypothetical protein
LHEIHEFLKKKCTELDIKIDFLDYAGKKFKKTSNVVKKKVRERKTDEEKKILQLAEQFQVSNTLPMKCKI